jgi:hypothetical protein
MKKARDLIQRILKRDFYSTLAKIEVTGDCHIFRGMTAIEVQAQLLHESLYLCYLLPEEVIVVLHSKVSMGKGTQNTLSKVTFYNKNQEVEEEEEDTTDRDLPDHLNFETFFICCKSNERDVLKEADHVVKSWMKNKGIKESD